MELYHIRSFVTGFFHFAVCSEVHPRCSKYQYFIVLLLNSVSLYGYTTFCSPNHQLRDLDCFHFLVIMTNAAESIPSASLRVIIVFISLG